MKEIVEKRTKILILFVEIPKICHFVQEIVGIFSLIR